MICPTRRRARRREKRSLSSRNSYRLADPRGLVARTDAYEGRRTDLREEGQRIKIVMRDRFQGSLHLD
jgi:hypothetical protein